MFPINILLVDDHALFAASLAVALEGYKEVEHLYTAQDMKQADALISGGNIDMILMDINLGKLSNADGLEVAAGMIEAHPEVKIIILTGYDLPVYRHEARKIGVSGFLNKNISPEELVDAFICVYQGKTCFPSDNNEIVIEDLTSMEKNILQLICSGKKRKNIAEELYMSERTLSNHMQHIFEKLGVSSTVEAVTKALQVGYISPLK